MSKKKYEIEELANILGQAGVLKARIVATDSEVGHKEHLIEELDKQISNVDTLRQQKKDLEGEVATLKERRAEDERQKNEKFKILAENGVPVSDNIKGTTIVSMG